MNKNNIIDIINLLQFIVNYYNIYEEDEKVVLTKDWIENGFENVSNKKFNIISHIHDNKIFDFFYDDESSSEIGHYYIFNKNKIRHHIRYLKLLLITYKK